MSESGGTASARQRAAREPAPSDAWRRVAEAIHRDPLGLTDIKRLAELATSLPDAEVSDGWRDWLLELCKEIEDAVSYYEAFHDEGAFVAEFEQYSYPAIAQIRRALAASGDGATP